MNKLVFFFLGTILACNPTTEKKMENGLSVSQYFELLPKEMTFFHHQGILNEVDDTLRLVLNQEEQYLAYHLNYYGEDYIPFRMKLFEIEGEKEPLIVINKYVWDVGDPFYETHFIQFDTSHQSYHTLMEKTTAIVGGRKDFFSEKAWQQVMKIRECQQEDMGYEMFPEIAFVINSENYQVEAILDGIEGFVDWCGLNEEEWKNVLAEYQPMELAWTKKGYFEK